MNKRKIVTKELKWRIDCKRYKRRNEREEVMKGHYKWGKIKGRTERNDEFDSKPKEGFEMKGRE